MSMQEPVYKCVPCIRDKHYNCDNKQVKVDSNWKPSEECGCDYFTCKEFRERS